jgi:hypothetical protein
MVVHDEDPDLRRVKHHGEASRTIERITLDP